jgi:hypothetical protein
MAFVFQAKVFEKVSTHPYIHKSAKQAIDLIEHRSRPHRRAIVLQFAGGTGSTRPAADRSPAGLLS